jgi:HSP20 family protein
MKLSYCSPTSCAPSNTRSGLEQFFRSSFSGFSPFHPHLEFTTSPATARLAADVYEDDAAYMAVLDLPGVKKEDVKLDLVERTLTVSAERRRQQADAPVQALQRSFTLPKDVSTEAITAKLEEGVLTLTLPKAVEARPRSINVA